jgi:hypothetical protein
MNNDLEIIHDGAELLSDETALAVRGNGGAIQRTSDAISPMDLIRFAIESKTPASELKELVALATQIEERNAAREFNQALKDFQRACPPILKNKTAKVPTKGGGSFSYRYAELDVLEAHVKPYLETFGFSYTFDTDVDDKGIMLTNVCTLLHENGHSRSSRFKLPIANDSAASPQQKVGIADTYAKRRALAAVLGLSITDKEAPDEDVETDDDRITEQQAIELLELVHRVAKGRKDEKDYLGKVLETYGVDALDHLPATKLEHCTRALNKVLEDRAKKAGAP